LRRDSPTLDRCAAAGKNSWHAPARPKAPLFAQSIVRSEQGEADLMNYLCTENRFRSPKLHKRCLAFFEEVDVLICPSASVPAFFPRATIRGGNQPQGRTSNARRIA